MNKYIKQLVESYLNKLDNNKTELRNNVISFFKTSLANIIDDISITVTPDANFKLDNTKSIYIEALKRSANIFIEYHLYTSILALCKLKLDDSKSTYSVGTWDINTTYKVDNDVNNNIPLQIEIKSLYTKAETDKDGHTIIPNTETVGKTITLTSNLQNAANNLIFLICNYTITEDGNIRITDIRLLFGTDLTQDDLTTSGNIKAETVRGDKSVIIFSRA